MALQLRAYFPATAGVAPLWLAAASIALAAPVEEARTPIPDGCRRAAAVSAAEGALVGAVTGVVVGGAVAGRHDRAAGALIGGVTGAAAGGALGARAASPCPEGYVMAPPPPRYAPPPPNFGPPARPGEIWWGAPAALVQRIDFLRDQLRRVDADGWLSPRERDRLLRRLDEIVRQEGDQRQRDGGYLSPDHADRLNDALVELGRRLHWDEYVAAHPELAAPPG